MSMISSSSSSENLFFSSLEGIAISTPIDATVKYVFVYLSFV